MPYGDLRDRSLRSTVERKCRVYERPPWTWINGINVEKDIGTGHNRSKFAKISDSEEPDVSESSLRLPVGFIVTRQRV
ncbi:hypothetical protein LTR03_017054 [Friedmanniomyces endolithicus]|nr:hypothetical protein LTR03_017054 [Friedmanniomyces endolithicus]